MTEQQLYLLCTQSCEKTVIIHKNSSEVVLYEDNVVVLQLSCLPVRLITPENTFTITKESLIQERQTELDQRISLNSNLNFRYLDVEDVFRSLDIKTILSSENHFLRELGDVTKPPLHLTYLVSIFFLTLCIILTIYCCRKRNQRCYCGGLKLTEILCCHCCKSRPREQRRPTPPQQDYRGGPAGDYLDPRPGPSRGTVRRPTRSSSPRGRYIEVSTD